MKVEKIFRNIFKGRKVIRYIPSKKIHNFIFRRCNKIFTEIQK